MKFQNHHKLFTFFLLVIFVVAVIRLLPGAVDSSTYLIEDKNSDSFVASGEASEEMYDEAGNLVAYQYGDFRFAFYDELWWTAVHMESRNELLQIPLHYGAVDVSDIVFSGALDESFDSSDDIYIAIDPNVANKYYTVALSETNFNLVKGIRRRPIGVCTEMAEGCEDRKILSCDNNPDNLPVIEFVLGEESDGEELISGEVMPSGRVEFEGHCVKVIGSDEEILKAADALILLWYGVI